jgi:NADH-quinone oxidoreductase subunit L
MYLIFTVLGYFGALLTAIYTFRLIFRVLRGDPCPEAQHLIDTGHVVHAEAPFNPATGETEDTDVGFPGEEHHIADQTPSMKIAMGVLAFLALFAGFVQVPGVDETITHFLDPVFTDSPLAAIHPSNGAAWFGLLIGAVISVAGIGIAWWLYVASPETPRRLQERFSAVHTFLYNKWYFDEAIDFLIVRPALTIGRFANNVFERLVIDGGVTGGTEDAVGRAGAIVRAAQNGIVRTYGLFLVFGAVGLALYFLIQQS